MSTQHVQKLWNYCNILRDDGLSYGDYVEQLTFLLFLKMADEQSRPPFNKPSAVPKDYAWPSLLARVQRRLSVVEELESAKPATGGAVAAINPAKSVFGRTDMKFILLPSTFALRMARLRQTILQKAFTGGLVSAFEV